MTVKRFVLALDLVVTMFLAPVPAYAYHDGEGEHCYEGEDCSSQSYDQWNGNDRNRNRDRNRGAFSPGPFDRSPVDIHDNQICISPDCSNGGEKK